MRDVTVCIPWRAQPERMKAFDRVTAFWDTAGYPISLADSDPALPFSICEARNKAVANAKTSKVIVADADTIVDLQAVRISLSNPGVTWPFTVYKHIPGECVDLPNLADAPVDQAYRNSVGGAFTTTQETYWDLGGMDERNSRQWGFDDSQFYLVAETLSTVHRVPGIAYSFNHPADRNMTHGNPNRHRYQLYRFAHRKPDVMRELIKR